MEAESPNLVNRNKWVGLKDRPAIWRRGGSGVGDVDGGDKCSSDGDLRRGGGGVMEEAEEDDGGGTPSSLAVFPTLLLSVSKPADLG